jgi:hypothetical protein
LVGVPMRQANEPPRRGYVAITRNLATKLTGPWAVIYHLSGLEAMRRLTAAISRMTKSLPVGAASMRGAMESG